MSSSVKVEAINDHLLFDRLVRVPYPVYPASYNPMLRQRFFRKKVRRGWDPKNHEKLKVNALIPDYYLLDQMLKVWKTKNMDSR
uniref:39S ribosomal protein L38, mitochondrial n=1 Tax=Syphacia muris TaxID=451379 RepID=A0A0N5AU33_9BILA